jgi:hypothetical protein
LRVELSVEDRFWSAFHAGASVEDDAVESGLGRATGYRLLRRRFDELSREAQSILTGALTCCRGMLIREASEVAQVPYVTCKLTKFTRRPQQDFEREVYVGKTDLLLTAANVGMPTLPSNPASQRSLLQMQWRMAMIEANVEVSGDGQRWVRSPGYTRLDLSEKSAVSYFLGMTQAALLGRLVLGYPHLQHLDLLLKHQRPPVALSNARRPDLVAEDPRNAGTYNAAIEVKGRSNEFDKKALDDAKKQAAGLTGLHGFVPGERVASVAYFNASGHWMSRMVARMVDPDGGAVGGDSKLNFGLETYLMLYYRTIIDAGRQAPSWAQDGDQYTFTVRGFPLALHIPNQIVEAYDASSVIGHRTSDIGHRTSDIRTDAERDDEEIITGTYRKLTTYVDVEPDFEAAVKFRNDVAPDPGILHTSEAFIDDLAAAAAERWDLVTGDVAGENGEEEMSKLFAPSGETEVNPT